MQLGSLRHRKKTFHQYLSKGVFRWSRRIEILDSLLQNCTVTTSLQSPSLLVIPCCLSKGIWAAMGSKLSREVAGSQWVEKWVRNDWLNILLSRHWPHSALPNGGVSWSRAGHHHFCWPLHCFHPIPAISGIDMFRLMTFLWALHLKATVNPPPKKNPQVFMFSVETPVRTALALRKGPKPSQWVTGVNNVGSYLVIAPQWGGKIRANWQYFIFSPVL